MIPYFLLILIPMLFYFVCVTKKEHSKQIYIGYGEYNRDNNLLLATFFSLLLLLLVCRGETVGVDLYKYKYIYERDATQSFGNLISQWNDPAFRILNFVLYRVTNHNFQLYIAIVSILMVLPIMYVYCCDRSHSLVKMLLFVNLSTFLMLFSGIRQALAISIGVLAYDCVKKHRVKNFVVMASLALLMHSSGFMVFLLYPIYRMRLKKKHIYLIVPIVVGVFILNRQIFGLLDVAINLFYNKYTESIPTSSAVGALLMFASFVAFAYIVPDDFKLDDEIIGLRNILTFALILQCFAPVHTLAMRINYYFIIFIPLALGKCFKLPEKKYEQLARLVEIVMCVFFALYFVYTIYTSYRTGKGSLGAVPYIPFWKGQKLL